MNYCLKKARVLIRDKNAQRSKRIVERIKKKIKSIKVSGLSKAGMYGFYLYIFFVYVVFYIIIVTKLKFDNANFTKNPKPYQWEVGNMKRNIEKSLETSLLEEKDVECKVPKLNHLSNQIMKFDKKVYSFQRSKCPNRDLVRCYLSQCRVVQEITRHENMTIVCTYRDIIYVTDNHYYISENATDVEGSGVYTLKASDHVYVKCNITLFHVNAYLHEQWEGVQTGLRPEVDSLADGLQDNYDTVNVLIIAFNSASRNGFLRKMEKTSFFLKSVLKAVVLEGYNVVGDGTKANLVPLLTGESEWNWPASRKSVGNSYFDPINLIFHVAKQKGYRTAYFEDRPHAGTFQFYFNGFSKRPADHYLGGYYQAFKKFGRNNSLHTDSYCNRETLSYKFMMNLTEQFIKMKGKKFGFTFITDLIQEDFNEISLMDSRFERMLNRFETNGYLKNTMLVVMGDHGVSHSEVRSTYQGSIEARLPYLAIYLPETLKKRRPKIALALKANMDVLCTPYDVYTTILDAINMRQYWNPFKVEGADLRRGLTLFKPIPRKRSCGEAGIEQHWCTCNHWVKKDKSKPKYRRLAAVLTTHINAMTQFYREFCENRFLGAILTVRLLEPNEDSDEDSLYFKTAPRHYYQIQISLIPTGVFEATLTVEPASQHVIINSHHISRIDKYRDESSCISDRIPHLSQFCLCRNRTVY